jgi:hypothetical protein
MNLSLLGLLSHCAAHVWEAWKPIYTSPRKLGFFFFEKIKSLEKKRRRKKKKKRKIQLRKKN